MNLATKSCALYSKDSDAAKNRAATAQYNRLRLLCVEQDRHGRVRPDLLGTKDKASTL